MWSAIHRRLSPLFETPHGSRRQILPIEGLRGFATLLVFLVHYVTLIDPWLAPYTTTRQIATVAYAIGHSGVDLFFVLSGYLIYGGLIRRPVSLSRYLRRRIQRIYPTFTAVYILYVAASWLVPSQSKLPSGSADAALYLAANYLLLPGIFELEPLITVAWSLSFEMFFYLLCPLLVSGLRLRRWWCSLRVVLFVGLAIGTISLAPWMEMRTRLAMFLAGMVLVEALPRLQGPLLSGSALAAVALAFFVCFHVEVHELGPAIWTGALLPAFYLLCLAAFQESGPLPYLFSWTPLRWFGNMSYSFFLLHGLVLKALFFGLEQLVPPSASWEGMFWALLPFAFLLALLASSVLFLLIERPFSLVPAPSLGSAPH